jgi:hypothetical protein
MTTRHHIERGLVIAALCISYSLMVPGLLRQGSLGVPALIIGTVFVAALIGAMVKRSFKVALLLACVVGISVVARLGFYFAGRSAESGIRFLASMAYGMTMCYCLIDLWAVWKRPHQPPMPVQPKEKKREFLIRRADGDWFDLYATRFAEVLKPTSLPSRQIAGWGDHRIEVKGCEISFSYEDPGFQICFETGMPSEEEAARIVEEIAASITAATGQQSRVVPL